MWIILEVFIEFVTVFFHFTMWLQGSRDFSSPTMDRTCTPPTGRHSLSPWTTREVPLPSAFLVFFYCSIIFISDNS